MRLDHRRDLIRLILPALIATGGLLLAINGSIWGMIVLVLGGMGLIVMASGRPLAFPRPELRRPGAADSPTYRRPRATLDVTASLPGRLALAFMFALGLSIGLIADRVLILVLPRPSPATISPLPTPLPAMPEAQEDPLINDVVQIDGQTLLVAHSALDLGQVTDIFDDNFETLMRGAGANPFIFEVTYPQPREASRVVLDLASMDNFEIKVIVTQADGRSFTLKRQGTVRLVDPRLEFEFPGDNGRDNRHSVKSVRVEILDRRPPPQEGFHTHVRGFALR